MTETNSRRNLSSWCASCTTSLKNHIEDSFEIKLRKTSIGLEIFCGYLHFISCVYVLTVIPVQLEAAGYEKSKSIQITALASAVGCVISSYITNLPFVISPPSSVSIYVAVALQQNGMNQSQGDAAVILSGFALLFVGIFKPLTAFSTKLIPDCIQASTAIGIGLITALAGAIELELVVPGRYSILEMGQITPSIIIALISTVIIAVNLYHGQKSAYISGLLFGTIAWWLVERQWPTQLFVLPTFNLNTSLLIDDKVISLLLNLLFLYILTLSGIARSMSDLSGLTNADGSIPRGNWLFIMCGVATILSGYFSGPPILISPESAPGIKTGARTGLSTLFCGLLFTGAVFFSPILKCVPAAATSPMLILVGLTLFVNASRIQWDAPDEAIPAFFVLLLIPFTYSILTGVGVGYVLYVLIGCCTGQLHKKVRRNFHNNYFSCFSCYCLGSYFNSKSSSFSSSSITTITTPGNIYITYTPIEEATLTNNNGNGSRNIGNLSNQTITRIPVYNILDPRNITKNNINSNNSSSSSYDSSSSDVTLITSNDKCCSISAVDIANATITRSIGSSSCCNIHEQHQSTTTSSDIELNNRYNQCCSTDTYYRTFPQSVVVTTTTGRSDDDGYDDASGVREGGGGVATSKKQHQHHQEKQHLQCRDEQSTTDQFSTIMDLESNIKSL